MGLNLTLISVVGVVIVAAGLFTYHTFTVSSMEKQLSKLESERIVLQAKNNALEATNSSLQKELDEKNEERLQIMVELEKFRYIDTQTQQKVADMERKLNDATYSKRLTNIRNSNKASLLLRFANNNVKCETEHFEEAGKCVMGKFKAENAPETEPIAAVGGGDK